MKNNTPIYNEILRSIAQAEYASAVYSNDFQRLATNRTYFSAIAVSINQIHSLLLHLPKEIQELTPEIPETDEENFAISAIEVWDTYTQKFPKLKSNIESLRNLETH
jgi:uncharacterized protein with HEPN domain